MPILDWMTRSTDVTAHARVPYRMLDAAAALNGGDGDPANLLIQGDNLDALKALLPFYAGRVKCIYIDPPYNTRSAFEHYDDNLEHAQWLAMITPRLVLLRELLAEDGSIWVSIDDNEGHYLKVLMDEVFGRQNFISNVVWQKIYTVKNSARHLSEMHDHIFLFAKNAASWKINLLPRSAELDATYSNPDDDPRGAWTTNAVQARNFYGAGTYGITSPTGRTFNPPPGTFWRVSKDTFDALNADGRVWWGRDGSSIPRIKRYLAEVKQGVVPASLWLHEDAGQNAQAKAEVRELLIDAPVFGTPKPEKLMERILRLATNPGDIVLDSFLGSGTTAAVAHKMGRRWIGIEMGPHAETHCKPRLDKVIEGEQGGVSVAVSWQGGGGYRYYRLGPPAFDASGRIDPAIPFEALAAHIWFAETGEPAACSEAVRSPVLGVNRGTAFALLYNGILGDRRVNGGNVLTAPLFARLKAEIPGHDGPWVIYGEACRMGHSRLVAAGVTFKQTPYDVKAR